ncbi:MULTISPECIES: UbiX family flavin prenyltransferase [unclassified Oceanispirochaeta]|uniref:UbiX family flavin prenyltransferase n=1 Tax=unclassified Oceanispirochaeta TaxID=2635722 RepID=UPI000E09B572|nr:MULTISPECIES: UbiX family flavin prenyltransferase [unclassified Oceanispirochaeta]MBF9018885.1 UbiX family flavin prenyltransferase [Oceanispirochaeta sp. M2]NPD75382.1 UbiX family flavin prenyltransferase [Oceanispirochaeta sp. M1]RDG28764.1 UbiX family flavin prenyltransferase [Oceanispirochaeta sp. M1]
MENKPLILGITGASGAPYALEIVRKSMAMNLPLYVILSNAAREVMSHETGCKWEEWVEELDPQAKLIHTAPVNEISHSLASGSFCSRGMVIAPCSMGSLGRIASGISGNLLERAADVCLKERRPLILMTRETPLNRIHLENMLKVNDAGGIILPPVPAFYSKPETVDDIVRSTVERVFMLLNMDDSTSFRWNSFKEKIND